MIAWGKRDSENELPLHIHMTDVAEVFRRLILSPCISRAVATISGATVSPVLVERLCVLAFLHDLGKINSGFQFKADPTSTLPKAGHVAEALQLVERRVAPVLYEAACLPAMEKWGRSFLPLFRSAIAHHGRPAHADTAVKTIGIWQPYRGYDPLKAARQIGAIVRTRYPLAFSEEPELPVMPELQHYFAGLVALADQIGSREDRFPYDRRPTEDLLARSQAAAASLLRDLRLDARPVRQVMRRPRLSEMFAWPKGALPKPMQEYVRDLSLDVRLAVLESETGSGKTEAALLRFHRLFTAGEVDALYFAVPTRAAASGLHARIDRAMRALLGEEAVLALPGYLKVGTAEGMALPDWQVLWDDEPDAGLQAARWAAETPRRYLASLAAVGTVDQAMLAGLRVKWAHFRAAALSRAFLVVDEVHSSDSYMQAVLGGVVRAHIARGGHVLLMSATLGAAARARWLGGARAVARAGASYPSLSWWAGGAEVSRELPHDGRSKTIRMSVVPLIAEAKAIAQLALEAAGRGARVLVVRNTVREAVAVQRAILALDPAAPVLRVNGIPAPHHGRFAAEDRRLLDAAVEGAFGKGAPPGPAIAVGSQTLEISLDLCADDLITDLCPIDVLLQRLGRLHRHRRSRPAGFETARCLVLTPETLTPDGGLTRYGLGANRDGEGVYPDIVGLEATRRQVVERPVWTIPEDNRSLVEAGTDPEGLRDLATSLGTGWQTAQSLLEGKWSAQGQQGRQVLVDRSRGFDGRSELFPDDENILTRLGGDRLLLTLPDGMIGPFGERISQITLPGHLARGVDPAQPPMLRHDGEVLRLRLGDIEFRYGPEGIERHG